MRSALGSPLAWLGLASIATNLVAFLRPFPLADWWQHARLDYTWLTQYQLEGQVRFLGAFALLFALYGWAYLRARQRPSEASLGLILTIQAGLGLALVGMYPVAAIDLYDYLLYGRLGLYWRANPLAHAPSEFPGEPMVAYSYWPNERSVYGPLWQMASEWITGAVYGQLPDGLYAFKLLALVAALGTTILIWLTLRAWRPELAAPGALLYGWNPLQQFETAGNGHNDALMVLFLALALLLLVRGPRVLVLPAFAAGLLVKITMVPLAPLLAVAVALWPGSARARLRDVGVGSALAVALVVLAYLPFWEGRASLPFLDRGNWFTASPPTMLRELLRRDYEFETAGRLAATICAAMFAVFSAVVLTRLALTLRRAAPDKGADHVVRAGYGLFFGYLVVACLWWQPWYLLVLLVFAALSGERALALGANLFCIGGLLSYPVFKYIWAVHQVDWELDYTKIMGISVVAIFTLPLVHLVGDWVARGGWRGEREGVSAARGLADLREGRGETAEALGKSPELG